MKNNPQFDETWDHLCDLCHPEGVEDSEEMQNAIAEKLICFEIVHSHRPEEKCSFHVLMFDRITVGEALPTENTCYVYAVDFYWNASPEATWERKKEQRIVEKVNSVLRHALVTNSRLFIGSADFWIWVENGAKDIPVYQKNEDQQRVKEHLLSIDKHGEIAMRLVNLPSKSMRRKFFCRIFKLIPLLPNLRESHLRQFVSDIERRYICKYFDSRAVIVAPLHIGWSVIGHNNDYFGARICGLTPAKYGNALMREKEVQPFKINWTQFLGAVPYEVSIPLIAYALFSTIKCFFPKYPSRISADESFSSIIRKRKRLMFFSLTGTHSAEIAHAFCGAFTDYGFDDIPTELEDLKWSKLTQSRVHDGVVILNQTFKNYETFQNNALLRDACVLLLNSTFEQPEREIHISIPSDLDTSKLDDIRCAMPVLLTQFIKHFNIYRYKMDCHAASKCVADIWNLFERHYTTAMPFADKRYGKASIKEIETQYKTLCKNCSLSGMKDYIKFLAQKFDDMKSWEGHDGIVEKHCTLFQAEANKVLSIRKNEVADDIWNVEPTELNISPRTPGMTNYVYLYSSIGLFVKFLCEQGGTQAKEAKRLQTIARQVFHEISGNAYAKDIKSFMGQYLSSLIESGKIICVRTSRHSDTLGWYDHERAMLYLLHKNAFEGAKSFWAATTKIPFPYSKLTFIQELNRCSLIYLQKNGDHMRSDSRIVVDPADGKTMKKESVLKIRIDRLKLSEPAQKILRQFSEVSFSRR